jgi:hypothetical protein
MTQRQWIGAFADKSAGRPAVCPRCGVGVVEWRLIGDLKTRVGYALLWCVACGRGAQLSRVIVPPQHPMRSFDDARAVEGVPKITFDDGGGD